MPQIGGLQQVNVVRNPFLFLHFKSHLLGCDPEHNLINKTAFPIAKNDVFDRKIHILAIDNVTFAFYDHRFDDRERRLVIGITVFDLMLLLRIYDSAREWRSCNVTVE